MDSISKSSTKDSDINAIKFVENFINSQGRAILSMSISDIALSCGVSKATIVRCCKNLGYSGLREYKVKLANGSTKQGKSLPIDGNETMSEIKQKVFSNCIANLQSSYSKIPDEILIKAIDLIDFYGSIDVYAIGGSLPVASYLRHQFIKLGIRSTIYSDNYTMHMSQSQLKSSDLILAISCSGTTPDIINNVRSAKSLGARTICITTNLDSPLVSLVDVPLVIANEQLLIKGNPVFGRVSSIVLVDLLFTALSMRYANKNKNK